MQTTDVAIVGGGILGLGHAWRAALRGFKVTVFERRPAAAGASIRNFGLIWPIGQPAGEPLRVALRSRELWEQLAVQAGLWFRPGGSLQLAHHPDEWAVIQEFFAASIGMGYQCELKSPAELLSLNPYLNRRGLLGGMHSRTEMQVSPLQACQRLPIWLQEKFGVKFHYQTCVTSVGNGLLQTGRGEWRARRVVICGGDDFETLFPDLFRESGLTRCKLQMMSLKSPALKDQFGLCLAGGLTLRFYKAYQSAPSLKLVQARLAAEMPEFEQWGIHVMAAESLAGDLTVGDSHEYGPDPEPFDKPRIDQLILEYLKTLIELPQPEVVRRWNGVYAKHFEKPWLRREPLPQVEVVTGVGGAGMTLSMGVAEETVKKW